MGRGLRRGGRSGAGRSGAGRDGTGDASGFDSVLGCYCHRRRAVCTQIRLQIIWSRLRCVIEKTSVRSRRLSVLFF